MSVNSDICVILIDHYHTLKIKDGFVSWDDIKDIQIVCEPDARQVTPQNSFKFIDAGVDYTLTRIACPTEMDMTVYMITAPSVWIPQKEQEMNGVYAATLEALYHASTFRLPPTEQYIFPGMALRRQPR